MGAFTFDMDALRESVIGAGTLMSAPHLEKVIFHEPATIVYWIDGTKTVVKCGPDDTFDPEKGIALCYMKKVLGNTGSYNNVLKKAIVKAMMKGEI